MIKVQRPNRPRPLGRTRPKGGGYVPPLPRFYCAVDLGHQHDFTSLVVVESITPKPTLGDVDDWGPMLLPQYHVRALDRTRGTPYPTIAKSVARMFRQPPFATSGALVVDATGVGLAVVQNMREAGLSPVAVTITGGSTVTGGSRSYRVPKVELIATLTVLFQQRRIKISSALQHAETLMRELEAMRMKITASGNDTYGGEGEHDDLVLALALGVWLAERRERRQRQRLDGRISADDQVTDNALAC